jgi:hypothetical protein
MFSPYVIDIELVFAMKNKIINRSCLQIQLAPPTFHSNSMKKSHNAMFCFLQLTNFSVYVSSSKLSDHRDSEQQLHYSDYPVMCYLYDL